MKLVNARGVTVVRVNRKKRCVKRMIPEGRYTMHVYHDGEAVEDSLRYAFIHRKKAPCLSGKTIHGPDLLKRLLKRVKRSSAAAREGRS